MRYKTFRQRSSLSSSSSSTASATHSLSSGDWLDPDASIHSTENHQRFGRSGSGSSSSSSSSKRVLFPWLTRLQHGTIQFKSVSNSPGAPLTNLTSDEDSSIAIERQFVYFPAGYFSQSDNALKETLHALGLYKLPNLLIVSADTDGVTEEQVMTGDECKNDEPLTYLEERESLLEKTYEILTGMLDHCDEFPSENVPVSSLTGLAGNVADMSATCRPDTAMSANFSRKGMLRRHKTCKKRPRHTQFIPITADKFKSAQTYEYTSYHRVFVFELKQQSRNCRHLKTCRDMSSNVVSF